MDIIYDILPLDIYLILKKYITTVIIQNDDPTYKCISPPMLLNCTDVKLNIYLDIIHSECVKKDYDYKGYDIIYNRTFYLNNLYLLIWIPDMIFTYNATKRYLIELDKSVIYNGIHTIHSDIIDYFICRDKLEINLEDKSIDHYIKYIPNKKNNYNSEDF